MRTVVRYSEAFKMQVVRELEAGKFRNPFEASRAYGVKGAATVGNWVRGYGKHHLLGKVVRVMKADEETELKRLRQEVKTLKAALGDAHLDLRLEQAYVKMACAQAGITDVEGFKKKHPGGQ